MSAVTAGLTGGLTTSMSLGSGAALLFSNSLRVLKISLLALMGPWAWGAAIIAGAAAAIYAFAGNQDEASEIMRTGTKVVDENTQSILRNSIAQREANEQAILAKIAKAEGHRDGSLSNSFGDARRAKYQKEIDEQRDMLGKSITDRLNMQKRLEDGLKLMADNNASRMSEDLKREMARMNKDVRAAYSDRMEIISKAYNDGDIEREEFISRRQEAIADSYDSLLKNTREKMALIRAELAKGGGLQKTTGLKSQIKDLQEEIIRLTELKVAQIKIAGESAKLLDKPGSGAGSRLENLIASLKAKTIEASAEIEGLGGEVAKFESLLKSGVFGDEGKDLLAGLRVGGQTLAEVKELYEGYAKVVDELNRVKKARRDELSAIDAITKKSARMTQEAATAKKEFLTEKDDTFVDRINREIDELLKNVPNATEELKRLAEVAKLDAIGKETFSNASDLIEDTRKINNSLLRDKGRYLAEYKQKVKEAKASIVKTEAMTAQEILEIDKALKENLASLQEEYVRNTETPMDKMLRDWEDSTEKMQEASARWIDDASDRLATFVRTGKLDFADLAESILQDIIKIQIQSALTQALGGGGGGGFLGDLAGGLLGSLGGGTVMPTGGGSIHTTSGAAGRAGGSMSGIGDFLSNLWPFKNGGVMSSMGKAYANGGVANSPQLALFGEGSMAEAFVPLPDGKSIPVTMAGGTQAPNVQVNVINQTTQEVTANQGQMKFDGKKMILDVVMAAASSPGPFRDSMRGAVR
ncbi:MAG: hypothetical protein MJK04_29495 [Psychrosphaera sp.]|nr:hypothetical protein [Psychrosphaera sp.]